MAGRASDAIESLCGRSSFELVSGVLARWPTTWLPICSVLHVRDSLEMIIRTEKAEIDRVLTSNAVKDRRIKPV